MRPTVYTLHKTAQCLVVLVQVIQMLLVKKEK